MPRRNRVVPAKALFAPNCKLVPREVELAARAELAVTTGAQHLANVIAERKTKEGGGLPFAKAFPAKSRVDSERMSWSMPMTGASTGNRNRRTASWMSCLRVAQGFSVPKR